MKNHQLINQTSGEQEYFTPQPIIEAARRTMGWINLDPASSEIANKRVRANSYYSKSDDGLTKDWFAKVFLNHPFGRIENPLWIAKLIKEFTTSEYRACKMSDACCLTFAATSEAWFQPLMAFPQCYLSPRTNYYLPDGSLKRGVSKGSVVTYLGPDLDAFAHEFGSMGTIKVKHGIPRRQN